MASPEENEESDWNSSRIKGFTFGDDDDTPFEQLATYQSISENSLSQSGSGAQSPSDELGVSFENSYSISSASNNQGTSTTFNVFSGGSPASYRNVNLSGGTYMAVCWTSIQGFSKFGSYVGNGNANGPFVYCG